ncbi:hypothetical protein [Kitasatospora sp. NBC_00458]|uniref:hypothetical protein n=1 Tax=Kitasatospora sp. NBC_00458 TaxID=2903568 RepID=UPI002E171028
MIRRTVRTTLAAAACSTVLAAGLAACGTVQQLTAAEKVSDAFGKIGASKSFSAKLSVDATPAQIEAFGTATGEKIDAESAAALSAVSLAVSYSADKPLKDISPSKGADGKAADALTDKSLSFSYALTGKGGKSLVELRQVGGKTYAQADLAGFATLVGEDPSQVKEMTEGLPPAVQGGLTGKWVSFDPELLKSSGKSADGKAGASPSAVPSLDPKVSENLASSLKNIFTNDVSFEDKGKKDGKELITLSAPGRKLADDLLKAVEPLAKEIPNAGKLPKSLPADVPDRKVSVDIYLEGGALSAVGFDLAQLEEKPVEGATLPVKIAFGKDAPAVQAPADAAEITSADIEGIFGGLVGGGLGGGGLGGAADSSDLDADAEPLTDAQVKELTKGGVLSEDQVRLYNKLGLGYDDIKGLASAGA